MAHSKVVQKYLCKCLQYIQYITIIIFHFFFVYSQINKKKFLPQTIYVDFEEAIHNSILSVWPEINIKGCRFHLGQRWWWKIQNLGLTNEYKSDSELSK